ncbi:hypothetical protein Hanom_Chr08g00706151 [Helianthus anomalus]
MLTETVTLCFSVDNLNRFSDDIAGGSPIRNDFDILEIEERVKVVEHMWDDAFVAAYEDLTDVVEVREAAITKIAKMSFRFIDLDLPPTTVGCGGGCGPVGCVQVVAVVR